MLTIAISVLFGLIACAALVQIHASAGQGIRRGRLIMAELVRDERETRATVRARSAYRQEWQRQPAAA